MRNNNLIASAFLVLVVIPGSTSQARAQAQKTPYPAMATLSQYLMPDEKAEIALARSAAPASISDGAEVMVLGRAGYRTAVKGSNGFLCIVERSWGNATDHPDFWNPRIRGAICFKALIFRTRPFQRGLHPARGRRVQIAAQKCHSGSRCGASLI